MTFFSAPKSDSLRSEHKFYPWFFLVRPKTIVFEKTYVLRIMFFSTREISEMRGPTGVKFCTMVSTRPTFIMPVQTFEGTPQKNFRRGAKNMRNLARFRTTSKFGGEYLRNGCRHPKSDFYSVYRNSFCVRRKSGEVWSSGLEDLDVESYPHKKHFSEDHISAPKGCCGNKFLHALENHQVLLAHPYRGRGLPYNFFQRGSNIALKCSVLNEGSLEPKGVASWDFATWRAARWGW